MRPGDRLCVTVKFEGNLFTEYTYFTHLDNHVEGEWVIVEAPRNEQGKVVAQSGIPWLARVCDTNPPGTFCDRATKWIVDRVDWDAYRARSALAPVIEGEK